VQDWDHALMLTGYDIHRGYGANSISGIARLDGKKIFFGKFG